MHTFCTECRSIRQKYHFL